VFADVCRILHSKLHNLFLLRNELPHAVYLRAIGVRSRTAIFALHSITANG
jgi:hypothetical protein